MSIVPSVPFVVGGRVRHPDFGLGIIAALDERQMTVHFDDTRTLTFARKSVPLARATWRAGQYVLVQAQNLLGVVREMKIEQGVCIYTVQISSTGQILAVFEAGLADSPEAEDPAERLAQQQFDDPKLFYFRTMGHYLAAAGQQLGGAMIAARIIPMAHQISVAQRIVSAPRQRFLLADEVGLGKTIETGLVLQELRARGGLDRVLIVVPPNLALQWLYELSHKFNERFKLYDNARIVAEQLKHPGDNVWEAGRNIICSHSYITSHPEQWSAILAVPWDMVVFDEAHHIRRQLDAGNRRSTTKLYRFASQISERTRGLLLLTATPMQLHPFELFSLIELVDQALFYSYEYFEEQREANKTLNTVIKQLEESERLDDAGRAILAEKLNVLLPGRADLVVQVFQSQRAHSQVREHLAARHLLSEVMIRNRKRAVGGFTKRIPQIIAVQLSEEERKLYSALFTYVRTVYRGLDPGKRVFLGFMLVGYQKRLTSSLHAFRSTIERRLQKLASQELVSPLLGQEDLMEADLDEVLREYGEQLAFSDEGEAMSAEMIGLRKLLEQARKITVDAKYLALQNCLQALFSANPSEQVVIFTQFLDTLTYLQAQLELQWPVALFHGAMSAPNKDAAVADFQQGRARILLTTEAGGEGRNLQFCSVLVNYDLPWNPMKVEQRIGRLDRIGQTRDVRIFNFSLTDTVEERVLEVLNQRIHAFEETIGGLDPILGHMQLDMQKIVLESAPGRLDAELTHYADRIEAEVEQARKADEVLRDFVMDWRSYDKRIQDAFNPAEQARLVRHTNKLSKSLLKHIGASIRILSTDSFSVKLGKDLRVDLPKLTRDTYQITFNYQQALADPLVEYGSFGHPLFDALLAYCTSDAFREGLTTRRRLVDPNFAGFRGFQFNFLVTVRSLYEVRRVVPIAIDSTGKHQPQLGDLLLDSFDWQGSPAPLPAELQDSWVAMVEQARDAAERVIEQQLREEVSLLKANSQKAYEAERRKVEQYCAYRQTEGERKVQHDKGILVRLRASDREEDQRVVPIWQRNVENDLEYLNTLRGERERLNRDLLKRLNAGYSYELLNAAWIVVVTS